MIAGLSHDDWPGECVDGPRLMPKNLDATQLICGVFTFLYLLQPRTDAEPTALGIPYLSAISHPR